MIDSFQLRELIIVPTLEYLDPEIPFSDAAVELLMMTAAHESLLGTYIKQVGGPALGIYQMEPATEKDIKANFLKYNDELNALVVRDLHINSPRIKDLVHNLAYATAMARVHYYRDKEALPTFNDIEGLAKYAKRVYNTRLGKATWEQYYHAYETLC